MHAALLCKLELMPIYFVFALAFVTQAGAAASRVVLTLYALKLGAPPLAIGFLAASVAVFPLLLAWLSGRLSDRFGSRWLLMCGAIAGAAAMLVPYFVPGMPAVIVAGAISGVSMAFFNVPTQNLVGLASKSRDRAQNFSNYNLVGSTTTFLGPLLAGYAIDQSGYAVTFLYLVALALVPVVPLAIWGAKLPRGTRDAAPAGRLRDMLGDPGVRRVLIATSLQHSGQDVFQFYLPVYAHSIGLSATTIGLVLASYSAATFVSRLILTRVIAILNEERVLAWAFFLGAASFISVPLVNTGAMLGVFAFMFGLGMGCATPITMTLMYNLSAEGHSGEALGLRLTVNHLTRVIGPVVFGAIGSAFGLLPIFWVNALMLASGGTLSRPKKSGGSGG